MNTDICDISGMGVSQEGYISTWIYLDMDLADMDLADMDISIMGISQHSDSSTWRQLNLEILEYETSRHGSIGHGSLSANPRNPRIRLSGRTRLPAIVREQTRAGRQGQDEAHPCPGSTE